MAQNQTIVTKSPTNPYGNSPKSLAGTPQQDLDAEMASVFASAAPVAIDPARAPAQADPLDAELAGVFGSAPAAVAADPARAALEQAAASQEPGQVIATPEIDKSGAGLLQQFKASFAGNDTEKLGFLEQQYGAGNARMGPEGKLQYSKDGGQTFENFNSKKFGNFLELFGGRSLVKEAALAGPEAAGIVIGGALGAPTIVGAPAGAVGGAATARLAFTPGANRLADSVAEWMGIPQDPTRNKQMENVVEQSVEAMIPGVAVIGKGIANKIGKRIPGTAANQAMKKTAAKADVFELDQAGKEVLSSVEQLKEIGLDVNLLNSQINTRSTPLLTAQNKVKNTPEIQSAIIRVGQDAQNAIEGTARALSDAKLSAKAKDGRIGEQVLQGAQALRRAEGAEIGSFKAKAMANTKNAKLPVPPDVLDTMKTLTTSFGFTPDGKAPKDMKALVGKFGLTSTGEVRSFVNALSELTNVGRDGTVRYSDLDGAIKTVGNLVEKAKNSRSEITGLWSGLASNLRTFKNEAIENGLSTAEEKLAFRQVNARYGGLLENVSNIEKLVNDDMGSHIVVDQLLGKGKEAVGNARALKGILEPATWEKLKGEWVEKQLLDFRKGDGSYNAAGLGDYFNKTLGPEFMEVIGGPKQLSNLKAALTVGRRVAETPLTPTGEIAENALKKTAGEAVTAILGSPFLAGKALVNAVFRGGQKGEEQKAIGALLSDEGFRRYVSGLPDSKRGVVAKKVDEMYDYMVTHKLMPPARTLEVAKKGAAALQDLTGRAGTQYTRQSFGQTGSRPQYEEPATEEEE